MSEILTVIMPVYNAERYLAAAIESILNQTFKDFVFTIVNDGSTDGSAEIIDLYASQDNRIQAIHQKNKGLVETLNDALAKSKTPLIARMDADDIACPKRFERQVEFLNSNPDYIMVGGQATIIDEKGGRQGHLQYPLDHEGVLQMIAIGSPVAHPAVMMRRDTIIGAGGYRQAFKHAEDYDLWLRVIEAGKIGNLQDVVLHYRRYGQSVSTQNLEQQALASIFAYFLYKRRQNGAKDPDFCDAKPPLTWKDFDALHLGDDEQDEIAMKKFVIIYGRQRDQKTSYQSIHQSYKALNINWSCHHTESFWATWGMFKTACSHKKFYDGIKFLTICVIHAPKLTFKQFKKALSRFLK